MALFKSIIRSIYNNENQIMIKNYLLFFGILVFAACDDGNPNISGSGSLKINFKATYGAAPLYIGNTYDYFGLGTIKFTKGDFFISDIQLSNETEIALVKEVDYISLIEHHVDEGTALQGLTKTYTGVKAGDYKVIKFDIGLSPELNSKKPLDYNPTHPLGEGTHYWSGWNSYIFSKTEGVYDSGGNNYLFTYHAGFDDANRSFQFSKDIIIRDSMSTEITIEIDYKKLFNANGVAMDIPSYPQIHNSSIIMNAFVNRFLLAVQVK